MENDGKISLSALQQLIAELIEQHGPEHRVTMTVSVRVGPQPDDQQPGETHDAWLARMGYIEVDDYQD